jgi:GH24 family phage-related lysozyme (muramidase)
VANFEQIVRRREGVRLVVYLDSLRKPTVGIGHLVIPADKLNVGDKITSQQVSAFFK